jgi:hypothetical protein
MTSMPNTDEGQAKSHFTLGNQASLLAIEQAD